jgi:hypothetical protein
MSLADLKKVAKEHRPPIKYYYVKSRQDLIDILNMPEMPQSMIKEKLRIQDLRKLARERNIPNIWRMRRSTLIELLYPDSKEDNKNNHNAEEHDTPKKGKGNDVRV